MKKEDNKKKNSNKKGFTLIELLAIIAILSLVVSITVGIIQNVIRNSKDKSYQTTTSNIEKNAVNFINEYVDNIFWKDVSGTPDGQNLEYECVKVQDLIDTGYFKGDVLDSYVADDWKVNGEDYIYVVIDKNTRTIKTNKYLPYNDSHNLCAASETNGTIDLSIPSGWAREKEISITYRVNRLKNEGTTLGYSYSYDAAVDPGENKSSGANPIPLKNLTENKVLTVKDNGSVCAAISGIEGVSTCQEVDKIDGIGPVVSVGTMSNNTFAFEAKIPIVIKDKAKDRNGNLIDGSGVADSTVEKLDFEVMVGSNKIDHKNISLTATNGCDNEVKTECHYDLLIKNSEGLEGTIKIVVGDEKIEDMVGNPNEEFNETVGEFKSTFIINYVGCEGTNIPSSQEKKYGVDINLSNNKPTRDGYDFVGWALKTNIVNSCNKATSKSHDPGALYKDNKDATFYAVWKIKKYTISYNACSGTDAPSIQSKTHGIDINLSNNKPTRDGYDFKGWALETNTVNSCTKATSRSHDPGDLYKDNKDATFYAVWEANKYTVSYNANGGTGTMAKTDCYYGKSCQLSANSYTRDGFEFLGWSENSNATTATYTDKKTFTYNKKGNMTLYAVWVNSKYTISYNANGGTGTMAKTDCDYGKSCPLRVNSYTRVGYQFLGWSEDSKATKETYKDKATFTYNKKGNMTLYAIWSANTYTVDYEVNIFSPFDSSRNITRGTDLPVLNITYNHISSNLKFDSVEKTSRLNNLLIGLNPLNFASGDQYEVTLTYVSGSYSGSAEMFVGATKDSSCMVSDSSCWITKTKVKLPTGKDDDKVRKDTITVSGGNGYLKQLVSSSNPGNVKFTDYVVNVVIRKKPNGVLLTQSYKVGDVYNPPSLGNVPVKLGYESITSWRLLNNNNNNIFSWINTDITSTSKTPITRDYDHKVYAKLKAKDLKVIFNGNGYDLGFNETGYTYDSIDSDGTPDEVKPCGSYENGDYSNNKCYQSIINIQNTKNIEFLQWRFKIQPFGGGETLWFGCLNKVVDDTVSGYHKDAECLGATNPTLGWYTKDVLDNGGMYYTRYSYLGGVNMSNFLGFDATAVAYWK